MLVNQRKVFVVRGSTGLFLPRKGMMPSTYLIDAKLYDSLTEVNLALDGEDKRQSEFLMQPFNIYSLIETLEVNELEKHQVTPKKECNCPGELWHDCKICVIITEEMKNEAAIEYVENEKELMHAEYIDEGYALKMLNKVLTILKE